MAPKDKYYRVPTLGDGPRQESGPGSVMQLPATLEVTTPVPIDFTISDDLPRWDAVGRVHEVLLRIRITDTTELDRIAFELNGEAAAR